MRGGDGISSENDEGPPSWLLATRCHGMGRGRMLVERLEAMYRRFSWRITSHYVSPWELDQIRAEVTDYEQWCSTWSRWAEAHVARGDEALAAGRQRTAGEAYARAALFYHWGSFHFAHDPLQLREALQGAARCVSGRQLRISTPRWSSSTWRSRARRSADSCGFLRIPLRGEPPPLVLLLPGADSTKEELLELGEHPLARERAVAAFDGPGQGLVSFEMMLRPDHEVAVRAMLDALVGRSDLDGGRVAVAGISYGGLFACRAVASDSRIRAVASISSWYATAGRIAGLDRLSRAGVLHSMGPDAEAVLEEMTLVDVAEQVRVPVLRRCMWCHGSRRFRGGRATGRHRPAGDRAVRHLTSCNRLFRLQATSKEGGLGEGDGQLEAACGPALGLGRRGGPVSGTSCSAMRLSTLWRGMCRWGGRWSGQRGVPPMRWVRVPSGERQLPADAVNN